MRPEPPSAPGAPAQPGSAAWPPAAWPAAEPAEPERRPLNRPVRWAVAAAEVVVAIALAGVAAWAWSRASVPYQLPDYQNPAVPDSVSRTSGPWAAAAVGAGLVAAILLLDAVREAVLAMRPPPPRALQDDGAGDEPGGVKAG